MGIAYIYRDWSSTGLAIDTCSLSAAQFAEWVEEKEKEGKADEREREKKKKKEILFRFLQLLDVLWCLVFISSLAVPLLIVCCALQHLFFFDFYETFSAVEIHRPRFCMRWG